MDEQTKHPTMSLTVARAKLFQALDAVDLSCDGSVNDRIEMFCSDSQLIVRQGYFEQSIDCSNCFVGQFSISFSSLRKWKRLRKLIVGDVTLSFADGQLRVANVSLPVKWQADIHQPHFAVPRISKPVPIDIPQRPQMSPVVPASVKTCGNFRVNVDQTELVDAVLQHCRASEVSDLYLRTWGGMLILDSGRLELRIDVEGKIDGFSVIPAEYLPQLALLPASEEKFTNVICADFELKILGLRIKVPRKALPVEHARSAINEVSQRNDQQTELPAQKTSRSESSTANQGSRLPTDDERTSLRAILRLAESMTPEQLADSGLSEIVAAAQLKRDILIQQAADVLRPLEITATQLVAMLR